MTDTAAQLRADMLPDNDDAYWEPADLDTFLDRWQEANLPIPVWYDASGAHLGIGVATHGDLETCARTLGLGFETYGGRPGVEWSDGCYDVRVEADQ